MSSLDLQANAEPYCSLYSDIPVKSNKQPVEVDVLEERDDDVYAVVQNNGATSIL